jgi:hypothetical protein
VKYFYVLVYIFGACLSFSQKDTDKLFSSNTGKNSTAQFTNSKIFFESNVGQIKNNQGEILNNVFFRAMLPGVHIWVTNKGITYNFFKIDVPKKEESKNVPQTLDWYRTEVEIKNANLSLANVKTLDKVPHQINYISQNSKSLQSNLYQLIEFANVYNGIDWKLFVENGKIKQEFIVHPQANITDIKLVYASTQNINIGQHEISFTTPLGKFNEGNLFCYQNKNDKVNSSYAVTKTVNSKHSEINTYEVKIETGRYDHDKILIVDPVMEWSTFYGSSNDEDFHAVYADANNNWVAGHTLSPAFPTFNPGSPSYYSGSYMGGFGDGILLKFTNAGVLQLATFLGGSGADEALSICGNGTNIWVSGYTSSTDFPVLNPGGGAFYAGANGGSTDGFLAKFNLAGTLIWSTYCGGLTYDAAIAVTVSNNELFLAGYSDSPNLNVVGASSFTQSFNGNNDGFLMKFNVNNALTWATYFGGSGTDFIQSIQANGTNLFVTGYTNSTNMPLLNGGGYFQGSLSGSYDIFLSKFSLAGNLQSSTYFGGSALDRVASYLR